MENKRDQALKLYLDGVTQREICKIVGVSNVTLKKWKDTDLWEQKKTTKEISVDNLINKMLVKANRELDNPAFNPDSLAKIISQLKKLKDDRITLADIINVFTDFLHRLMERMKEGEVYSRGELVDLDFVKKICDLQDQYVQEKAK